MATPFFEFFKFGLVRLFASHFFLKVVDVLPLVMPFCESGATSTTIKTKGRLHEYSEEISDEDSLRASEAIW